MPQGPSPSIPRHSPGVEARHAGAGVPEVRHNPRVPPRRVQGQARLGGHPQARDAVILERALNQRLPVWQVGGG